MDLFETRRFMKCSRNLIEKILNHTLMLALYCICSFEEHPRHRYFGQVPISGPITRADYDYT